MTIRMSAPATKPIIVIGMHRSGTSMVIRMLQLMGVFTGWELDANGEAVYFVLRNQAVLQAQGASWDHPAPIDALLAHEGMASRLVKSLERELSRPAAASYLGPWRYLRYRSLRRIDRPWGWKDPRNTLLLRFWLRVFPGARVVHVVRNGVDAALSLARREARRLEYVLGDNASVRGFLQTLSSPPEGCSPAAWMLSQIRLRLSGERLARRIRSQRVHPVIDPSFGFALWEEYLSRAAVSAPDVADGVLQLRYEDVLRDPSGSAQSLAAHCGVEPTPKRLAAAAATVDTARRTHAYAFGRSGAARAITQQPHSLPLAERAGRSRWLRELGYEVPTATVSAEP